MAVVQRHLPLSARLPVESSRTTGVIGRRNATPIPSS